MAPKHGIITEMKGMSSRIRQARRAGLCAANGLGMLVEQAAVAFATWTGQAAPLSAMWAAVAPQKENP